MKKRMIAALLVLLVLVIPTQTRAVCITVDNSKCDSLFGHPNCSMAPLGNKCIYDEGGCRSTCGATNVDDCDPDRIHCGPWNQLP